MIKKGKCITSKECGYRCCTGCNFFTDQFLCGIYENRPRGCRAYPHNPMALEKGCTLYFEEIIDNKKITITPDNYLSFPDDMKRRWLKLFIEKSTDE